MERGSLLVSDLDNTLLGDHEALRSFSAWYDRVRGDLRLVYNSGRFPDSVRSSIDTDGLPEPDAIIAGVGTEIWLADGPEPLEGWPSAGERWCTHAIRALLAEHPGLEPQPGELQSEFKLSYYAYEWSDGMLQQLQSDLLACGYDVELVYSSNRDLDILPAETHKGSAAARLCEHWSIPTSRVIACGDSGNDLTMFTQGFFGVVVGNAHDVLKQLNQPGIYHSPYAYAAGVLDGVQHWLGRIYS